MLGEKLPGGVAGGAAWQVKLLELVLDHLIYCAPRRTVADSVIPMTDVAQPTPEQVRAAAEALKAAIDRHLGAVEHRSGESDPAVFTAFDELAAAADAYDELLYDAYDEVTPFEVPSEAERAEPEGAGELVGVSLLMRRDYAVVDRAALLAAGRHALRDSDPELDTEAAAEAVSSPEASLAVLLDSYDPDDVAARAEELGLEPGDATLWALAAEPSMSGEWLERPFEDADPDLLIYRADVTVGYDEEADELDLDELDVD